MVSTLPRRGASSRATTFLPRSNKALRGHAFFCEEATVTTKSERSSTEIADRGPPHRCVDKPPNGRDGTAGETDDVGSVGYDAARRTGPVIWYLVTPESPTTATSPSFGCGLFSLFVSLERPFTV